MESLAAVPATAQQEPEPSFAASAIVSFLPLILLFAMIPFFLRLVRRSTARAEEAVSLYREMLAELRLIRVAVEGKRPG